MTDLDRMGLGLNISSSQFGRSTWVYYRIELGNHGGWDSFATDFLRMLQVFDVLFSGCGLVFRPGLMDVRDFEGGSEFYLFMDNVPFVSVCSVLDAEGVTYIDCTDALFS